MSGVDPASRTSCSVRAVGLLCRAGHGPRRRPELHPPDDCGSGSPAHDDAGRRTELQVRPRDTTADAPQSSRSKLEIGARGIGLMHFNRDHVRAGAQQRRTRLAATKVDSAPLTMAVDARVAAVTAPEGMFVRNASVPFT